MKNIFKNFIFTCVLFFVVFSLILTNTQNNNNNNNDNKKDEILQFFKDRGIENSSDITREQFGDLIENMLIKTINIKELNDNNNNSNPLKEIIKNNLKDFPKVFAKVELNHYFKEDLLINIVNEYIRVKYSPEEVAEFEKEIENAKKKRQEL